MSAPAPVEFPAPVIRETDGMRMHYLPLPDVIADAFAGIRRVLVTLGGHTVRRAILSRAGGGRYLALSRDLMRTAGLSDGDLAIVTLEADPEPDRIDLGELADALADDPEAQARWDTFTPGRQRSYAHYVTSAKRPETRAARAREIAHKLATHTLYGDLLARRDGDA